MFAVIVIPDFTLQAVLRHEPGLKGSPVALLEDDTPKSPVWQVTASAARFGVSPGISSIQAKARCQTISFRVRSPVQEEAAQEILLECAYSAAAFIESTAPGICTLDLRGLPLTRAAESFEEWAMGISGRLAGFDLECRVGIARTPALAAQAAQVASPILYVADPNRFWRSLPVTALYPSAEMATILEKWGIETVSEFTRLGKEKIAERLGAEGVKFFESARADTVRPLKLTSPRLVYQEFFQFEHPVETVEPLLFILRRFLDQLTRRIEQAFMSVDELVLGLKLDNGRSHDRSLKIPAPTREVEVLFRIVHNYLETVRTDAPVVALALEAKPCAMETQQFQLFESALRDPSRFYETIGRLNALLGPDRVGTPVVLDSHRPDDVRMERIKAGIRGAPARHQEFRGQAESRTRGLQLRRYRPPIPATVRLRDGQPIHVRSARLTASIMESRGPWRSSGNWWENLWTREEWDVQTRQGELFRIYLEGNQWFVEGAYD